MQLRTTRVAACPPDHHHSGWKIEIVERGKSVSRLWIVDKVMRIRGGQVRIGGISTVGTDEKWRGRGLARRLMEAALELMIREKYPASVLHGIPDFYDAFGYGCCLPDYEVKIALSDLEKTQGNVRGTEPFKLRAMRPADRPAVARLYNRENAERPGSIVRDAKTWRGFPRSVGWFMKPGVRLAVDASDRPRGYVVFDARGECRVAEAGGAGAAVNDALLAFLAARARSLRAEEITMVLPPDHPLALHARARGARHVVRYPRNGEFMGRVIDAQAFAAALGAAKGPKRGAAAATKGTRRADSRDPAAPLRDALGFPTPASLFPCMYWPDRF